MQEVVGELRWIMLALRCDTVFISFCGDYGSFSASNSRSQKTGESGLKIISWCDGFSNDSESKEVPTNQPKLTNTYFLSAHCFYLVTYVYIHTFILFLF
jgi:hypothetical protein